jgi:hypothetical protein
MAVLRLVPTRAPGQPDAARCLAGIAPSLALQVAHWMVAYVQVQSGRACHHPRLCTAQAATSLGLCLEQAPPLQQQLKMGCWATWRKPLPCPRPAYPWLARGRQSTMTETGAHGSIGRGWWSDKPCMLRSFTRATRYSVPLVHRSHHGCCVRPPHGTPHHQRSCATAGQCVACTKTPCMFAALPCLVVSCCASQAAQALPGVICKHHLGHSVGCGARHLPPSLLWRCEKPDRRCEAVRGMQRGIHGCAGCWTACVRWQAHVLTRASHGSRTCTRKPSLATRCC